MNHAHSLMMFSCSQCMHAHLDLVTDQELEACSNLCLDQVNRLCDMVSAFFMPKEIDVVFG